jgi:hypothetical protein
MSLSCPSSHRSAFDFVAQKLNMLMFTASLQAKTKEKKHGFFVVALLPTVASGADWPSNLAVQLNNDTDPVRLLSTVGINYLWP